MEANPNLMVPKPGQSWVDYFLDKLVYDGDMTPKERKLAGIVNVPDDSMSPPINYSERAMLVVIGVEPIDFPTLLGKVVLITTLQEPKSYFIGRVAAVDEQVIRLTRDNATWPQRETERKDILLMCRCVYMTGVPVL
ncbi:hypothetical protein GO755_30405 [Spirosoma sp. HMF4905]|uniref:Peptidase S24/S26A/S26B/S26C domain-containing protein n=1 Tax=Spirosoma arboris TaxID=2682092 RepID=A0A7K1SL14_9BACT|nr:hypothetical protein [Spirosoma arboris]MVM34383.1 hypothetical protein [Spirosoma arboris]